MPQSSEASRRAAPPFPEGYPWPPGSHVTWAGSLEATMDKPAPSCHSSSRFRVGSRRTDPRAQRARLSWPPQSTRLRCGTSDCATVPWVPSKCTRWPNDSVGFLLGDSASQAGNRATCPRQLAASGLCGRRLPSGSGTAACQASTMSPPTEVQRQTSKRNSRVEQANLGFAATCVTEAREGRMGQHWPGTRQVPAEPCDNAEAWRGGYNGRKPLKPVPADSNLLCVHTVKFDANTF